MRQAKAGRALGALLAAALLSGAAASAHAGDITGGVAASHLEFVLLHKKHGSMKAWPQKVGGDLADLLATLRGQAEYIVAVHTTGLKTKDVILMNSSAIRPDAAMQAKYQDFGTNCRLIVHIQKGSKDITISGSCNLLMVDPATKEQINAQEVIQPVKLKEGAKWVLLYANEEHGIAMYARTVFGTE